MTRMRRIAGSAGSDERRSRQRTPRWLVAAGGVALAASCAPSRAAVRPGTVAPPAVVAPTRARSAALPRTLPSEFDPIGVVLELREELALSDAQVRRLLAQRRLLRGVNRARFARLDSLNDALDGRLDGWLATARGAEPSLFSVRGRVWLPKVPAVADTLARQLLACVRADAREAARDALQWLGDEQRDMLERLRRSNPAVAALRDATSRGAQGRERTDTAGAASPCGE